MHHMAACSAWECTALVLTVYSDDPYDAVIGLFAAELLYKYASYQDIPDSKDGSVNC